MKIKHLIITALVIAALTLVLSGCGSSESEFEGKTIVTFNLQGGTLNYGTSSTNTYIKYAYDPGTYLLDPSKDFSNYKLSLNGYNFTGWYTSEECNPEDKWDFSTALTDQNITLYAGWERAIVYSYTVYYVDGENDVALGTYTVKSGDVFDDWRKFADSRAGYTAMGYYSDRALSNEWDYSYAHPGGSADLDVAVYVDYMDGEWKLVSTAAQFKSAIKANNNIYLLNDIDLDGTEPSFNTYSATLNGNGYEVKNFTVKSSGAAIVKCAIFSSLGDGCVIENVSFADVVYEVANKGDVNYRVAALAVTTSGAVTITNVTVSGVLVTEYSGEFPGLSSAVFTPGGSEEITGFVANISKAAE